MVQWLVAHAKENIQELAMVFIDVSKAFNSVAHESLVQELEYKGILEQLRNYFKLAFKHAQDFL